MAIGGVSFTAGSGQHYLSGKWASNPPRIDGVVSEGEWDSAIPIDVPYAAIRVLRDQYYLYLLLDFFTDTHEDPDDSLALLFDVDKDGQETSGADIVYNLQQRLQRGLFSSDGGLLPLKTSAESAEGFGPSMTQGYTSPKYRFPHRIWELGIPFKELKADFTSEIHFVLKSVYSSDPPIDYRDPGLLRRELVAGAPPVTLVVYAPELSTSQIEEIETEQGLERIDVTLAGTYRYGGTTSAEVLGVLSTANSNDEGITIWARYKAGVSSGTISGIESEYGLTRLEGDSATQVYRYSISGENIPADSSTSDVVARLTRDSRIDYLEPSFYEFGKVMVRFKLGVSSEEIADFTDEYNLEEIGQGSSDLLGYYYIYSIPIDYSVREMVQILSRDPRVGYTGAYNSSNASGGLESSEPLFTVAAATNVSPDWIETTDLDPESIEYQNSRSIGVVVHYAPNLVEVTYEQGITEAEREAVEREYDLTPSAGDFLCDSSNICTYEIPSSSSLDEMISRLSQDSRIAEAELVYDMEHRCTGFLVASDIVWTLSHCFSDPASAEAAVVFGWEKGSSTREAYLCHTVQFWPSPSLGSWPQVEDNDEDKWEWGVTLLQCQPGPVGAESKSPPGEHWGTVTICDTPLDARDPLYLIHQSECADPTCHKSGNDPNKKVSFGIVADPQRRRLVLVHDADTLGGSSGGPIFSPGAHHVVAYHRGSFKENGSPLNWGTSIADFKAELERTGWWQKLSHC